MRFTLSGKSPLNAVYTNEAGKAIYKVTTPHALTGVTTSVSRVLPSDLPGGSDAKPLDEERFGHLATIKHVVGTSIINFGGEEFRTGDHFKRVGILWRDKSCIGPNGKAYQWHIRRRWGCKFVSDDGEETILAKYIDSTCGIIGPASPASFEIFPAGEEIMDYIFVTFLYVEKVRRDRKKG